MKNGYCFVPIIPVGGKKIENLQKGKTFTYIGDCLFNGTDGIIRDEKSRQRIALVISCKRTRSRINKL